MIGSHNIPPPPSNDGVFIAAVIGEPGGVGSEKGVLGGVGILIPKIDNTGREIEDAGELGDKGIDIEDVGKLTGMGGNPDIILENSTGSIPDGTGLPEAAAAATISAGVGS